MVTSHHEGMGWIPSQYVWNLCCTKRNSKEGDFFPDGLHFLISHLCLFITKCDVPDHPAHNDQSTLTHTVSDSDEFNVVYTHNCVVKSVALCLLSSIYFSGGFYVKPEDGNIYTTLEPTLSSNPNVFFQRGGVHPGMMYWGNIQF